MFRDIYNFLISNKLLNSTFYLGLVTFVVGFTALLVYLKQRRDRQREAATTLLSELQTAVTLIPQIKSNFTSQVSIQEGNYILNGGSWNTYKYLVLRVLKPEQWAALDTFYRNVQLYDNAVHENDKYFDNNASQVWVCLHKHYLKIVEEFHKSHPTRTTLKATDKESGELKIFNKLYVDNAPWHTSYYPAKTINMVKKAFDNLDTNILTSSVGERLNEIANPNSAYKKLKLLINPDKSAT